MLAQYEWTGTRRREVARYASIDEAVAAIKPAYYEEDADHPGHYDVLARGVVYAPEPVT